jgi:hypothetical protein
MYIYHGEQSNGYVILEVIILRVIITIINILRPNFELIIIEEYILMQVEILIFDSIENRCVVLRMYMNNIVIQ